MKKIFVAVDESPAAMRAARAAAELAAGLEGKLTLVHVSMPNLIPDTPTYHSLVQQMRADEDKRALDLLNRVKGELGSIAVETATLHVTGAAEDFVDAAEQQGADILVVGSRGKNALARVLLGSFADRVIHVSKRSVLVVR